MWDLWEEQRHHVYNPSCRHKNRAADQSHKLRDVDSFSLLHATWATYCKKYFLVPSHGTSICGLILLFHTFYSLNNTVPSLFPMLQSWPQWLHDNRTCFWQWQSTGKIISSLRTKCFKLLSWWNFFFLGERTCNFVKEIHFWFWLQCTVSVIYFWSYTLLFCLGSIISDIVVLPFFLLQLQRGSSLYKLQWNLSNFTELQTNLKTLY